MIQMMQTKVENVTLEVIDLFDSLGYVWALLPIGVVIFDKARVEV
jgi:hypothetical protein